MTRVEAASCSLKSKDDLALDVIAEAVKSTPVEQFIERYEAARR